MAFEGDWGRVSDVTSDIPKTWLNEINDTTLSQQLVEGVVAAFKRFQEIDLSLLDQPRHRDSYVEFIRRCGHSFKP